MSDTRVLSQIDNQVMTITINRPDKKNALDGLMYQLMREALERAASDPGVRVVLVQGSHGTFTSGNDLRDFATWAEYQDDLGAVPVVRLIKRTLTFEKPLVAAVTGSAVGIGTTLLLHCDVVVADRSALFCLPFVRLGLVPEFASSLQLPLLAGHARAGLALMLGEPFDTAQAAEMGIVSRVCEVGGLETVTHDICAKLAAQPPAALRAVKALMRPPDQRQRLLQAVDEEMRLFAAGLRSAEHHEAVSAFMEKRTADFSRFE